MLASMTSSTSGPLSAQLEGVCNQGADDADLEAICEQQLQAPAGASHSTAQRPPAASKGIEEGLLMSEDIAVACAHDQTRPNAAADHCSMGGSSKGSYMPTQSTARGLSRYSPMSEVFAPRYLAGLVSTHGHLRSQHLCQTPFYGGEAYPVRTWLSS